MIHNTVIFMLLSIKLVIFCIYIFLLQDFGMKVVFLRDKCIAYGIVKLYSLYRRWTFSQSKSNAFEKTQIKLQVKEYFVDNSSVGHLLVIVVKQY